MSDRSTLSVLLEAREAVSFPKRLTVRLGELLESLGASLESIDQELNRMSPAILAPSNNRSILGCMRDAELAVEYLIYAEQYGSVRELETHLTNHIHKPKGSADYQFPGELAVKLVSAAVRG
jgi:hypothetical protein